MSVGVHLKADDDGEFVAFVYIPLFPGDVGKAHLRGARPEFIDRKPDGVKLAIDRAEVIVRNSGIVASDVVTLDWRVRFCTLKSHKPNEGFTVDHAGEGLSPVGDLTRLDFIEGGGFHKFKIRFPEPPAHLKNVYFQARVYTLWSGNIPVDKWAADFEWDAQITEAHIAV